MEKISDVEKAISLNEELLSETKERLRQTTIKLSEAQSNVKNIQTEITALKEKRQAALARGIDAKAMNDSLKKLESELELESETCKGLEDFLKELRVEENTLMLESSELPKRILQLKSISLANEYNSLAEKMVPVIEQLNAIFYKLGGNGNSKENLVAFYPLEGAFKMLPKVFFDVDGVGLADYVSRHPGQYHGNLPPEDANFYHWPTHENRLRNNRD